jgi:signal transduction histidine kinase
LIVYFIEVPILTFVLEMKKNSIKYYWIVVISILVLYSCSKTKKKENKINIVLQNQLDHLLDSAIEMQNINTDSSIYLFKEGLRKSKEIGYKNGMSQNYKFLSFTLSNDKNDFINGFQVAKDYLEFAKKEGSEKFIASAYTSLGSVYTVQDITDSASYYYLNAIDYAKKTNDKGTLGTAYMNIVVTYIHQRNFKKGVEYSFLALNQPDIMIDKSLVATIKSNLYNVYLEMKDTVNAYKIIKEAYSLYPYITDVSTKNNLLVNMSSTYFFKQQYDSAYQMSSKSLDIATLLKDTVHIIDSYADKAFCLHKMGKNIEAKNEIEKADPLLNKVIAPLERSLNYYDIRADIFKHVGNLKEALTCREQYLELKDSMYKGNEGNLAIQTENEIKQKEFEKNIAEKQLKITKKNNAIILLLISIAALSIIGFLFYRNQRKRKLLHEKNISFLKKENEWQSANAALEAQLQERNRISREIHDELGASLTSIALSTELLRAKLKDQTEEVDKISNTSSTMVDSLNEIIWSLNSGNDSLKSLVAYTRKMFFSFLDDTTIVPHFHATPINEDVKLPGSIRRTIYLTTKEALNNAIKHAQAKHIKLNMKVEEEKLILQIQDDGKGITSTNEFGNGLRNMKENIEKIGGYFSIQNDNGVTVIIEYSFKK